MSLSKEFILSSSEDPGLNFTAECLVILNAIFRLLVFILRE
jgi:hypothetical protein